jgi:muconate cycloisomerase
MEIAYWHIRAPLTRPYRLSFATLEAFDCFYVRIACEDQAGYGEVTPLPGYSAETPASVAAALGAACDRLAGGALLASVIEALVPDAPMAASGLACAAETLAEGSSAFSAPLPASRPVVALCDGATLETTVEAALSLHASGYRTLKMKIGGRPLNDDLARVKAVRAALGPTVALRLDANQALSFDEAAHLGGALADQPQILLEQPFAAKNWGDHERLAAICPLPLMLDEAIWSAADIDRASRFARAVKLKLCKHPGLAATRALADRARGHGLKVVLGNGVQSALGNHFEARLHGALRLATAGEFIGFARLAAPVLKHRLQLRGGALEDGGLLDPAAALTAWPPARIAMFKN